MTGPPTGAALFAAGPTPSLAIDGDDRVREANPACETLFNLSRHILVGRRIDDLIGPGPTGAPVAAPYAAYDQVLTLPGGRRVVADVMAAPLAIEAGWRVLTLHPRSPGPIGGRRDGGQRSATAAAAMLAHEIKNPLSAIRGAAQLLDRADDETAPLTRLIRDEVDRIARLIDRMEGFTDSRPLVRTPQNIHAILAHARDVAVQGFAGNVTIRESYDPSLPPVLGDRDALVQIFVNLIKNAVEAVDAQSGEIVLRTGYRSGLTKRIHADAPLALPIEVCVIDDGPGAPDDIADHLFEPFVTSKRSGSGLGLALVDKLIGDHGAVVEYRREGNPVRTVVRLLLPRVGGRA
ncbi:two-component system sensor histidine kinase NtrB [Sphingomonas montana]|uniref:two-component system sensor histidine kinase NtrB n=1 Tax=Sphingomonas montana TaxID=1843236 RepID=UPI001F0AE718|nr:ATP-binding protein [Sphingomonas montana]